MSKEVNVKEVLKGLSTNVQKAKDGEIYAWMDSAFELQIGVGKSDVEVWVLTPTASKTLLERLNAELRVPEKGDRIYGSDGWYIASISYYGSRICEKKPEPVVPEIRFLEPGEPVMPGDRLHSGNGDDIGEAYNHYKNERPRFQNSAKTDYSRKPWTEEEYRKRQAAWVKFHDLKPGDTVKVCCKAVGYQDGWQNSWVSEMDGTVGQEVRVIGVSCDILMKGTDGFSYGYPFYVLQVTTGPAPMPVEKIMHSREPVKPEFREFRTTQEVLTWVQEHGQIVIRENGDWSTVVRCEKSGSGIYFTPADLDVGLESWKSAKDGTPFGVLVT